MSRPTLLFVCERNGGKSQLAAALMRHRYPGQVRVFSAGTAPGDALNAESVAALGEVGASVDGEYPKPVTAELLDESDHVVLVGPDVELRTDVPVTRWVTDEPSERGIGGMERMRLLRDDIAERVAALGEQLGLRPA